MSTHQLPSPAARDALAILQAIDSRGQVNSLHLLMRGFTWGRIRAAAPVLSRSGMHLFRRGAHLVIRKEGR